MGIINIGTKVTKLSIIDKPSKNLLPFEQELLSFAKTVQKIPNGCEELTDIHTRVLCEMLESIDIKEIGVVDKDVQLRFYVNFIKLICIDVIMSDVSSDTDIIQHVQYKSLPPIIFMLLEHNNTTFLRTYAMIDACLAKMISIDNLLPFFVKFHSKSF